MKKLFVVILVLAISSSCFAETIEVKEYKFLPLLGASLVGVVFFDHAWHDYDKYNDEMKAIERTWQTEKQYLKAQDKRDYAKNVMIFVGTLTLTSTVIALCPTKHKIEVTATTVNLTPALQLSYHF